jgi:hypothetical protein
MWFLVEALLMMRFLVDGRGETLSRLRRQLGAPFCPPPFEHEASGFGCHARAEPVGSRPFQVAWLERAFH